MQDFGYGAERFIIGLSKKVLLANTLGSFHNMVVEMPESSQTVVAVWIGIICFTFQIYFDFSGYSDMAIGLGRMFGFHFKENFNYPYISKSVTEFWRRWHISLSTWFKDYLYIPLGGNRKSKFRKYINLLIVFLTSGLWHGAELSFVLWGLIHGVFNVIENIFGINKKSKRNILVDTVRRLITFTIVVFAFIYFRAENIHHGNEYLMAIINNKSSLNLLDDLSKTSFGISNIYPLLAGILILFVFDLLKYNKINLSEAILKLILPIRWLIYLAFIFAIIIFGIYGPEFSESAFIYFQF